MKYKVLFLSLALAFAAYASTVTIPNGLFLTRFGRQHPFMLKSHGPNPIFTQAGYTFRVEAFGHELYAPLYYDAPVFIDYSNQREGYELCATKESGPSVGVTVLAGPEKGQYTK